MLVDRTPLTSATYLVNEEDGRRRQVVVVRGRFIADGQSHLRMAAEHSAPRPGHARIFRDVQASSMPTCPGSLPPTLLLRNAQDGQRVFLGRATGTAPMRIGAPSEMYVFDLPNMVVTATVHSHASRPHGSVCRPLEVRFDALMRVLDIVWWTELSLVGRQPHEVWLEVASDDLPPTQRRSLRRAV